MNEPETGWRAEQAVCQHCGHQWAAVCPAKTRTITITPAADPIAVLARALKSIQNQPNEQTAED